MATDTASTPIRPATRPLWQIPTFLVGIACLWAMWSYGDRVRPTVAERYNRSLSQLRQALDRMPPDIDQVQLALRKLPGNEPPADLAGQVRFLTGSAYVALAEATTSANEATECWAKAKEQFDQIIDIKQVADADQRRFRYRRARMWANTNAENPQKIIDSITETITSGDDLAEGYRLMADLSAKLPEPDDMKIRDHWRNYLKHAGSRADARTLNQARVKVAELHAKLNEPEEARKVIERVGADAPPEIYASARLLAGKFHLEDEDWNQAVKVGEQVRDMKGASEAQKAQALIQLAEAYQRLNRLKDAEAAAKKSVSVGLQEGRSAAVKMAGIHLAEQTYNLEAAVGDLETAVKGIRSPRDWPSDQVPAAEVRKHGLDAHHKAVAEERWNLALRAAKTLVAVADEAEAQQLVASAHEQLAERQAIDPVRMDDARQHYRSAADAYTTLGRLTSKPSAKGDLMRKAALLHNKGEDRAKAIAVLNELVLKVTDYPDAQAGSAWSELADIYYEANERKNALLAYENAAARPGPAQWHAKVRYAALLVDEEPMKLSLATTMLEEVLAIPEIPQKHKDVHEEALYLLGELLTQAKEWQKAESRLRSALTAYPESKQAIKGRLQFGQCFRYRANLEARKIEGDREKLNEIRNERLQNRRPSHRIDDQIKIEDRIKQTWKNYDEFLKQAYEAIRQAEDELLKQPNPNPELIRRASFYAADCANWLGQYDDCASRYQKLVERYRNKAEELEALRDLHRCCRFAISAAREDKNQANIDRWSAKQNTAYKQLQEALARIPDLVMDGSADVRKRAYWENWLKENTPTRE